MFESLLSALLLTAQPAHPPAEADAMEAHPAGEHHPAHPPAPPEAEEPLPPEEETICRRRLVPSERIGQRHRVVRDCRTRAEWDEAARRR